MDHGSSAEGSREAAGPAADRSADELRRLTGQLFRAAFKTSGDAYALVGRDDGRLVEVNDRFLEMFGYRRDEVIGRTSLELGFWPYPDQRGEVLAELAAAGEVRNWPVSARRNNGEVFPVHYSIGVLEGSDPPLILGVIRDITEQRRMDEELRASEVRFRTLVDKAPSAIGISRDGRTIYVNQKYLEMFGFSSVDELEGRPLRDQWSAAEADMIEERARRRSRGLPAPTEYEATARRKDGSLFPAHVSVTSVDLPDGPATLGFITDLSEQKRSEGEKARLEAQFRQAQKMEAIGQLAGGVAHDFNNILAAILMQTELVGMADDLPPDLAEGIRHVREYAERAANLTRQLLLFSRRQVMQARDVDVNELVINLAKMLQRIIGEDLRLHLHLSSQPLTTRGDPGHARAGADEPGRQCPRCHAGGRGRRHRNLQPDGLRRRGGPAAWTRRPGDYVCLRVTDTGCGIPTDILPRIFEPFFTTKDPAKGTGLGLATVFGIVKQHGGIGAGRERQAGRGTTFRVLLPLLEDPAQAPPQIAPGTDPRGTETVLVVEDDESVRKLTRITLERQGYTVFEAASGREALRVWVEHRAAIRLLLTDLVMPEGLNGRELAARVRADSPSLPVVFMSGYSSDLAGRELTLESGQRFVQKPYPPHQLLDVVRQLLDERGRSA